MARAKRTTDNLSGHGRYEYQAQRQPPGPGKRIRAHVQAGEREEHRHQHDHRQMLDTLHQAGQQAVVARQDRANQECTKHLVQAECAGGGGSGEHQDQQQAQHRRRWPSIVRIPFKAACQRRSKYPDREANEDQAAAQSEGKSLPIGAGGNQCQRNYKASEHIVESSGGERKPAFRGFGHAAFLEDARHHRKRGDRQRSGHEQCEGPEGHALRCKPGMQERCDGKAQCTGQQHAGKADCTGSAQVSACATRQAQFGAHHKHEQHQAKLAQAFQRSQAVNRKQGRLPVRRQATKHQRTKHDAGQHLADHRWLVDMTQHGGKQARHAENGDQLQEQDRHRAHAPPAVAATSGSYTNGACECELR